MIDDPRIALIVAAVLTGWTLGEHAIAALRFYHSQRRAG